jgi:hypothetical protein
MGTHTDEVIIEAMKMYKEGKKSKEITEKTGVTQPLISVYTRKLGIMRNPQHNWEKIKQAVGGR